MKKFNQYYFAFGSNLSAQRVEKREVEFSERITAVIYDYKLTFDKQATGKAGETYANIQPEKGSIVEGVLYLTDMEGIKKLDRWEGVEWDNYIRKEIEVVIKYTQKKVTAWVYIAHPSKIAVGKPSREYLEHILAGKDVLSENYYQQLTMVETI